MESGPEALRLAELAEELGVSHPAILHHFGSREGLVQAVVSRAITALNHELIEAFAKSAAEPEAMHTEDLLHRIAETLEGRGQARLAAWLILSGAEPPARDANVRLHKVSEVVHGFRKLLGHTNADPAYTNFLVELTALALLADAVFGEQMRRLEGLPSHAKSSHDFRVRLAKLIDEHLEAAGPPSS